MWIRAGIIGRTEGRTCRHPGADYMGTRFAAFFLSVVGAGIELFGAIYGQGVIGTGMLFGMAGRESSGEAAIIGFALATLTIVAGVLLMFVRDPRSLAITLIALSTAGTLVAGQLFGIGAALGILGAILALRVDRSAPLI